MNATTEKERAIIFPAPMIRAIQCGQKTQTRRYIKPQPLSSGGGMFGIGSGELISEADIIARCPYGARGDRLWVREAWSPDHRHFYPHFQIVYRADNTISASDLRDGEIYSPEANRDFPFRWRSSFSMPRNISRITLEITGVRAERLQDIKPEELIAEGWPAAAKRIGCCNSDPPCVYDNVTKGDMIAAGLGDVDGAIEWFADLWDSINGKSHPWESNPWVWAIEFRKV